MFIKSLLATALLLAITNVNAATVTQWNFNSIVADGNTSTGTILPAFGTGTAVTIGGITTSFASGDAGGGSSDPAIGDDSGWQTLTYAAQGQQDKLRGVQFNVSTVGFTGVSISYDLRHSNTSSRFEQVQYSTNGSTFTDIATFDGNLGDTWFKNRNVDLSAIAAVNNNAAFAFRVVGTFAPSTFAYAASSPTGTYGPSGTLRFDMVTVSALPVPEPESYALMLAGLALVGAVARRRRG